MHLKLNLGSLEEQQALITTRPFLSKAPYLFLRQIIIYLKLASSFGFSYFISVVLGHLSCLVLYTVLDIKPKSVYHGKRHAPTELHSQNSLYSEFYNAKGLQKYCFMYPSLFITQNGLVYCHKIHHDLHVFSYPLQ